MIFDFIPGAMDAFDHGITEWDEPVIRKRPDGTLVKGRPTRGFGGGGTFSYAGKEYTPEPWTPEVFKIKLHAEALMKAEFDKDVRFTFCLAGLYPDGEAGIPHHSDTVPTLDDIVFSISFGAPRVFVNRVYDFNIKDWSNTSDVDKEQVAYMEEHGGYEDFNYLMQNGDAIVFDGNSQLNSTHAVPPVFGVGERVNLTFRTGI